ncbi:aminopeptidase [Desulfosporosinus fructosivorans]|uniref:aminopeptidase n=1 Tax=Desulfosporosinus fructosivorans TaxID=2018669 RepID=UPI00130E9D67|nr:aminopeptidase [Desulfosporosinus fructosivorans]
MPKVGQRILESLAKNQPIENLLFLTDNLSFGYKLKEILNIRSPILSVPMNVSVLDLASSPEVYRATHIIELYSPTLENSIYLKELRQELFKQGKLVLALWNWDERYLEDDFWGDLEYQAISVATDSLMKKLSSVKKVKITSELGTDISFSIEGRTWLIADGYCEQGKLAQLPDGEIYTCPIEETFSGQIVVDGTISRLWLPREPLKLEFEAGALIAGSPDFMNWINLYAGGVRNIGEFAIGMNPTINKPYSNISTDEKEGGSVHFAIGDSYSLGLTKSVYHVDFVIRKPKIHLDDHILQHYLPGV